MHTQQPVLPKLLFVDDEPGILSFMLLLFQDEPYDILTASGGAEALELIQESDQIQLIISDYRMPVMTGVEFMHQVMLRWPDTRRVILSGYTDSDILLGALNEGRVHRFLVKPLDNGELKKVVCEMFEEYEILVKFRRDAEELARSNRLLSRTNEQLSAMLADVLANLRRGGGTEKTPHPAGLSTSADVNRYASLSQREREILFSLASGQTPKAIAMDLNLSIKTVSTYKKRIFDKMGFKNDAQLISYAIKNNLLPASM